MRTFFKQVRENTQGPWDWIMLVGLVLLAISILASISFSITSGKPSEPLWLAGQVAWAYVTVVFTLDSGYKLYNDLHAKKFSLVPGRRKALVYRLFYAALFPAFCWLVLFTGGMFFTR